MNIVKKRKKKPEAVDPDRVGVSKWFERFAGHGEVWEVSKAKERSAMSKWVMIQIGNPRSHRRRLLLVLLHFLSIQRNRKKERSCSCNFNFFSNGQNQKGGNASFYVYIIYIYLKIQLFFFDIMLWLESTSGLCTIRPLEIYLFTFISKFFLFYFFKI